MAAHGLRGRLGRDRVAAAVVGVALLAVLARVVALGGRVTHYDEARVAWWTLEFARTGEFHYRFIIHGPFIQHVNTYLFALIGASDFTIRLVPALVGGLLPLSALLLRQRLGDVEVVALALFLAVDPVLLYYSRFSRSTVLVAAFMFVAFALFVRALDTSDARLAYAGVAFAALGFTAKENAIVYLLCWLGAGVLVVDSRLFSPLAEESGFDRLRGFWRDDAAGLRGRAGRYAGQAALAAALFVVIFVYFYAPRGVDVGLWRALTNPAKVPGMIDAMLGTGYPDRFDFRGVIQGFEYWFGRPGEKPDLAGTYVTTLGKLLGVLVGYAAPLFGLSVVGFLAERYASARPRALVMFASYWGFASVLGYPLGTDIWAGWIAVNALVPLAVPAAVGLGLVYRWGRESLREDDRIGVGLAALLVVLLAAWTAGAAAGSVYIDATGDDNELVQYAQPSQELRPGVAGMAAVSPDHDGTDVLVYDEPNATRSLVDGDQQAVRTPACLSWHNSLPLPWYFAKDRMDVACAGSPQELDGALQENPAFVVVRSDDRGAVEGRLSGYEVYTVYHHRTTAFEKVIYVRSEYT